MCMMLSNKESKFSILITPRMHLGTCILVDEGIVLENHTERLQDNLN